MYFLYTFMQFSDLEPHIYMMIQQSNPEILKMHIHLLNTKHIHKLNIILWFKNALAKIYTSSPTSLKLHKAIVGYWCFVFFKRQLANQITLVLLWI